MADYLVEERTMRKIIPREAGQRPVEIMAKQYRRKEIIISILGVVTLSAWSAWEDIPTVNENGDPA